MTPFTGRKRIFTVMIEALQNALKHGIGEPVLQLDREHDHCVISIANRMLTRDRETLSSRLSRINTLDDDQLRSAYLEGLKQPANGENCGLGLITMRRKSGLSLEFNFTEIDTLHSYFYLRVRIAYSDRT